MPYRVCLHKVLTEVLTHHEYVVLSHTLKNTANQRPGLLLHILRYTMGTGNMQ